MPRSLAVQTVQAGVSVDVQIGTQQSAGAVVLYNESNTLITVSWGSSSKSLPAWTGDAFYLNKDAAFTGKVTLTAQVISSAGGNPSSVVAGDVYAPGEAIQGTYPVALVRQANLGNNIVSTSANSVVNDGNAAGTSVVEATQSGQASSSLSMKNDGTVAIAVLSLSALLAVLTITPGGASAASGSIGDSAHPTNWALHGVADQVPAAGVQAGTLVSGVNLTKLSSDGGTLTSDGSGNVTGVSFKGDVGTTRNGTAGTSTIFTGTNTPSSPSTGDIWIKA